MVVGEDRTQLIHLFSLKHFENAPSGISVLDYELGPASRQPQKIVAKLVNGVRIGLGFMLERTCRADCTKCPKDADAFHRSCRIYEFKPHYQVALRVGPPDGKVYTPLTARKHTYPDDAPSLGLL